MGEKKSVNAVERLGGDRAAILAAVGAAIAANSQLDHQALAIRQRLNQSLLAACQKHVLMDVVAALWAGADPTCSDAQGLTPLHLCARLGHADMAQVLIDRGAMPAAMCRQAMTPAQHAAKAGHDELAKMLVRVQERASQASGRVAADREDRLKRSAQSALRLVHDSAMRASFPRSRSVG